MIRILAWAGPLSAAGVMFCLCLSFSAIYLQMAETSTAAAAIGATLYSALMLIACGLVVQPLIMLFSLSDWRGWELAVALLCVLVGSGALYKWLIPRELEAYEYVIYTMQAGTDTAQIATAEKSRLQTESALLAKQVEQMRKERADVLDRLAQAGSQSERIADIDLALARFSRLPSGDFVALGWVHPCVRDLSSKADQTYCLSSTKESWNLPRHQRAEQEISQATAQRQALINERSTLSSALASVESLRQQAQELQQAIAKQNARSVERAGQAAAVVTKNNVMLWYSAKSGDDARAQLVASAEQMAQIAVAAELLFNLLWLASGRWPLSNCSPTLSRTNDTNDKPLILSSLQEIGTENSQELPVTPSNSQALSEHSPSTPEDCAQYLDIPATGVVQGAPKGRILDGSPLNNIELAEQAAPYVACGLVGLTHANFTKAFHIGTNRVGPLKDALMRDGWLVNYARQGNPARVKRPVDVPGAKVVEAAPRLWAYRLPEGSPFRGVDPVSTSDDSMGSRVVDFTQAKERQRRGDAQ